MCIKNLQGCDTNNNHHKHTTQHDCTEEDPGKEEEEENKRGVQCQIEAQKRNTTSQHPSGTHRVR
jgi:hypothetical protein